MNLDERMAKFIGRAEAFPRCTRHRVVNAMLLKGPFVTIVNNKKGNLSPWKGVHALGLKTHACLPTPLRTTADDGWARVISSVLTISPSLLSAERD